MVHQHVKPYQCRLEDCSKRFTQLGNLKVNQSSPHHILCFADMICSHIRTSFTRRFYKTSQTDLLPCRKGTLFPQLTRNSGNIFQASTNTAIKASREEEKTDELVSLVWRIWM